MPTNASRITEQILCDADTYHLGTAEFWEADEQVKKELQLREGPVIKNWEKHTLFFLQHHRYYTSYCKEKLGPGHLANIALLQKRLEQQGSDA